MSGYNQASITYVEHTAGTYTYRAVAWNPSCDSESDGRSVEIIVTVISPCQGVNKPTLLTSSNLPNEKTDIAFVLEATVYGGNQDYVVQWMRAKVSGDNKCPGSVGNGAGAANYADISGAYSLRHSRAESTPGVYKYKVRIWPRCGDRTRDGIDSDPITVTVSCPAASCPGYLAVGGEYKANRSGYINTGGSLVSSYPYKYRVFTFMQLTSSVYVGNQPYFSPTGGDLCFYKKDAPATYVWSKGVAGCKDSYATSFHDGTSGWRLPNIAELGQLQSGNLYSRISSAPTSAPGTTDLRSNAVYWSITEESAGDAYIWVYNSKYARAEEYSKICGSAVRCVKTVK